MHDPFTFRTIKVFYMYMFNYVLQYLYPNKFDLGQNCCIACELYVNLNLFHNMKININFIITAKFVICCNKRKTLTHTWQKSDLGFRLAFRITSQETQLYVSGIIFLKCRNRHVSKRHLTINCWNYIYTFLPNINNYWHKYQCLFPVQIFF